MLSRCLNTVSWAACILKRYYLYPTFKFVMLITQLLAGRMLRAEYKCHGAMCQRATAEKVKYIFTGARGWNTSAMFSAIVSLSFPPTLSTLGSVIVCLFYICVAEPESAFPRRTCFTTLARVLTSHWLEQDVQNCREMFYPSSKPLDSVFRQKNIAGSFARLRGTVSGLFWYFLSD